MQKVLVLGAGNIGVLIAAMLAQSSDYLVHLLDVDLSQFDTTRLGNSASKVILHSLDVSNQTLFEGYLKSIGFHAVLSALPYFCNEVVAIAAKNTHAHYFDLTEDVKVTQKIESIAKQSTKAFVPQCGLAPGFISIAANHLMSSFDTIDTAALRVGALPMHPNNALKYALTWSVDGLINGYANPCWALINAQLTQVEALEGLESLELDGDAYEVFNTSGGLGSLGATYAGKVANMNYKTIRYPGHCAYMRFLMKDLKLESDLGTLKQILEKAIPKTMHDVVVIYAAVKGKKGKDFIEDTFAKKCYPKEIAGKMWSAIAVTTASSACAVLDTVLQNQQIYQGFITQETFALDVILQNRFGKNLQ